MNRKIILLAIVALALVSLACSININLPAQAKTGPTVIDKINVPFLADQQAIADVTLNFGAGKLNISPGAGNELIGGSVTYNVVDFKPKVTIDSNNINIEQGNIHINGIPYINRDIVNEWDLTLGNRPISLVISAGAYSGTYELGGLSLHRLDVTDGAADVHVSFSQPNKGEMVALNYTTGASDVTLTGLANANPTDLNFHSGAGTYTLDFSGQLTHDMNVSIESGVSTVKIIVPQGTAASLTNTSTLVSVTTSGGWEQNGNNYQLAGSGNKISIQVKMGAGTLQLETSTPGR